MKKKVAYIISNINKSLAFEWINENLNKNKFEIIFILLNPTNSVLEDYLVKNNTKTYRVRYGGKRDLIPSLFQIIKILLKEKVQIVHTHLFEASLIGILAAKIAGVKRRIYTRHNSTLFHVYHPNAVKYDKFVNYLSTDIIAISEPVKEVLINMENVPSDKITLIHHGFKLSDFEKVPQERIDHLKRKYLSQHPQKLVIGVISRYIHWKGIQYIIPAFKKFLKLNPDSVIILSNTSGPYKSEIKKLLSDIPPENYIEISFEEDVFALYKLFDIFIHVPIDKYAEAFGQIYVESLASGIPSIFTLSGIATEFIEDRTNALVVPFQDSESIYQALLELSKDKELRNRISLNGKRKLIEMFDLQKMILSLEKLYDK